MSTGESKWTDYVYCETEQVALSSDFSDVYSGGVLFEFRLRCGIVFSGFSSAPGDCLNRGFNLAFQAVSIAVLPIS
jgi:hypothetical protein